MKQLVVHKHAGNMWTVLVSDMTAETLEADLQILQAAPVCTLNTHSHHGLDSPVPRSTLGEGQPHWHKDAHTRADTE